MCQFPKVITTYVPSPSSAYLQRIINIKVPCGHCLECKRRRANEWLFRLQQEMKQWRYCSFLTLTYRNSELPIYSDGRVKIGRRHRGMSTLHHPDLQKFFKRLRYKKYGVVRFKYFAIGEYGYNGTVRPHYHVILFHNSVATEEFYTTVSKVWNKGRITCSRATVGRLSYVAKYCSGGCVGFDARFKRPYMVCSLRSPIGYSWLNSDLANFCFERGQTVIDQSFVTSKGQRITYKMPIPRFYLRKMGMQKTFDDLIIYNQDSYLKERFGVPKSKTVICGCLEVDSSYYTKCRQTYDDLVKSHSYREYEQHIKFDFSTWLISFHQYELNARKKRRSPYLTVRPLQPTLVD